jgi:hypothetical protein
MMNPIVLEGILAELRPVLLGRVLSRPRAVASQSLAFELTGDRKQRLWLDARRDLAGIYLLGRDEVHALSEESLASGSTRHAALLFRKHLAGRRVSGLRGIWGERTVVVEAGAAILVLRLSVAPSLTLVVDDAAVASIGDGAPAWPLPADRSETEKEAALAERRVPTLLAPRPIDRCADADLVPPSRVALAPAPLAEPGRVALHPPTWLAAAALLLHARTRGARFARRERLEAHLVEDAAGLDDPAVLRRHAEALLAWPGPAPAGARRAEVPDPYAPGPPLQVPIDPGLSVPANAQRLFARARRMERAREKIAGRLDETRAILGAARAREARVLTATSLADLPPEPTQPEPVRAAAAQPRRYLTSRGLALLVGRGARENQRLTFQVARPDDLWLHALDRPGAHVILRDDEGRAGSQDMREAAEVAAFFSAASEDGSVDVQVARRKHLRQARGGPGRVLVSHSETLRVAPRDPEGRLRRR